MEAIPQGPMLSKLSHTWEETQKIILDRADPAKICIYNDAIKFFSFPTSKE